MTLADQIKEEMFLNENKKEFFKKRLEDFQLFDLCIRINEYFKKNNQDCRVKLEEDYILISKNGEERYKLYYERKIPPKPPKRIISAEYRPRPTHIKFHHFYSILGRYAIL